MRFLFYSHDAVGLGHMRRNMTLAARLAERIPEASVLLAIGTDEVSRLGVPAGVEVLKLPGLRKVANECYDARHLAIPGPELLSLRASVLEALVLTYRPDVLIVDKHPLGASGELRPALDALRAIGKRAVLGVRDILDDRETVRREWTTEILEAVVRYYDRVLVYGQRNVFDPLVAYGWPVAVAERVRFCGYVVSPFSAQAWREEAPPSFLAKPRSRPLVLGTAGSGEDGFALLSAFLDAADGAPWQAAIVTGPMASRADHERLRSRAETVGVECQAAIAGLGRWLGAVDALVSMGGYNTLVEALSSALPTVCVPRVAPRREQLIRSRAFVRLGLLRSVEPYRLSRVALRRAVALALATARRELAERAGEMLDFDGATRAAEHLVELATGRPGLETTGVSRGTAVGTV